MTTKNPDQTRAVILEAAFEEFFRQGFTATSLDAILKRTGVTKGALYHHFANKDELGFAVIDDVIGAYIRNMWIRPLEQSDDPITALAESMRANRQNLPKGFEKLGCPLNTLSQEMSARSESFRAHISALYEEWRAAIADAFRRGQAAGTVRSGVDPEAIATFILAAKQGMSGMVKSAGDLGSLDAAVPIFLQYLETLRPTSPAVQSRT